MATSPQSGATNAIKNINGLDLSIDKSIDKICETSNSTSTNTRNIWYIIMLVCTLSYAEFWNTHPNNVTIEKLERTRTALSKVQNDLLIDLAKKKLANMPDTFVLKTKLSEVKSRYDNLDHSYIGDYQTIHIPILGNAFDISNLSIFADFAFIILLLTLKYILTRKISNLKITLIAITERYTNSADEISFAGYLSSEALKDTAFNKDETLAAINYHRRKYHYNYLCMSETFISDGNDIQGRSNVDKMIEFGRRNVFYLPLLIALLLLGNDLWNISVYGAERWAEYRANAVFVIALSVEYIAFVWLFSYKCYRQSATIEKLYINFRDNGYKFIK